MTDINAIKSRVGSISPTALAALPQSVQKLLKEDVPHLIHVARAAEVVLKQDLLLLVEEDRNTPDSIANLCTALEKLK